MPTITYDKYIDDNGNEYEYYDDGVLDYLPTYADRAMTSEPLYGNTYKNWIGFGGSGKTGSGEKISCHYPGSSGRYRLKIVNNFPHNNVVLFLDTYIYGNFISGVEGDKDRNTYRLRLYAGSQNFALGQGINEPGKTIICDPDSSDPKNLKTNNKTLADTTKALNEGILLSIITDPVYNRTDKYYHADYAFNTRELDPNYRLICDLGEFNNYNNPEQCIYFAGISYYQIDKVTDPIISYALQLRIPYWEHYLNYFPGSVRYDNNNSQDWYSCNRDDGK